MKRFWFVLLFAVFALQAKAQPDSPPPDAKSARCAVPPDLTTRLSRVPPERVLFDGKLRIVNVYKRQAEILLEAGANDRQAAQRWVSEVYPAHKAFWAGYVGDEAAFSALAKGLMAYRRKLLCEHVPKLLALDLNSRFERHAAWLQKQTGKSPVGTWYLAYGSGATDMGGLGKIGMVIDFSSQEADPEAIEKLLTHELAHQIHGQRQDAHSGTVLGRMVAEGLATYIACVYADGKRTAADCIGYSDAEWAWAVRSEAELKAFAKPILYSSERADSDSIASRSVSPVAGGSNAIGYFLGYRIVQAYTQRHGKDSWKSLLDMPVKDVLERSRYRF